MGAETGTVGTNGVRGGDVVSYLHVAVSDGQLQGWKDAAAGRDLSLSEWVRMALDREVVSVSVGSRVNPLGTPAGGVFAADCPGTHMAGVWCDGCGGSKW